MIAHNSLVTQEFDTPLHLFHTHGGIFRGMCERSGITSQEIEKASLKAYMT